MSSSFDLTPWHREITALAADVTDLIGGLWGLGALAVDDDEISQLMDIVNRIERRMAANLKNED
jgi:hypothetical protein